MSPEGRHCHQRVGTVTRGSALSPEGRHCHQRVGTVTRGSAATSEGRQRRQRVGSDVRGSAWSSGGSGTTTCPPVPRQGILDHWWASWIIYGRPGSFMGVLDRQWASRIFWKAVTLLGERWHRQDRPNT